MKKRIIWILLPLLMAGMMTAQGGRKRDRVQALRVEFITKKLELTDSESAKFWPVYDEYYRNMRKNRERLRSAYQDAFGKLDEKTADELVNLSVDVKQREAAIYRDYVQQLRPLLGTVRIARLHHAEEQFRREVLNTIRERGD